MIHLQSKFGYANNDAGLNGKPNSATNHKHQSNLESSTHSRDVNKSTASTTSFPYPLSSENPDGSFTSNAATLSAAKELGMDLYASFMNHAEDTGPKTAFAMFVKVRI